MLTATYAVTSDDFAAFQKHVLSEAMNAKQSPVFRGLRIAAGFGIGIGIGIGVASTRYLPGLDGDSVLIGAAAVTAMVALFAWRIITLNRRLLPQTEGILIGPRTLILDDDGVREEMDLHSSATKWSAVREVHDTSTHLFVMIDCCMGYIVPKRVVDEVRLREIQVELHQRIGVPTAA